MQPSKLADTLSNGSVDSVGLLTSTRMSLASSNCVRRMGKALFMPLLFGSVLIAPIAESATTVAKTPSSVTFYTDVSAFLAAAPPLVTENFENGNVAANETKICSDPFDSTTADACWSPGGIQPRLSISSYNYSGTVILGALASGSSIVTGADFSGEATFAEFFGGSSAVGLDLIRLPSSGDLTVTVFGVGFIETTTISAGASPTFLGAVSSPPILGVYVEDDGSGKVYVDNVRFGPAGYADMAVSLAASEPAPGTLTYSVTVENLGVADSTGGVVTVSIPDGVTYLSDDCGGSGPVSWTANFGALPAGGQVACHIITAEGTAQGIYTAASVQGNEADSNNANNFTDLSFYATGIGPDTPQQSLALFRSFPDLAFKDETGAPFSMSANSDKVILIQMCAAWCGPCAVWTNRGASLKAAVDSAIGPGNFIDIDIIYQSASYQPSTQQNALNWKTQHNFPGPVLHAEGSDVSAVTRMANSLDNEYLSVPDVQWAVPYFFVLSPGCDNQIVAKGTPDLPPFNEERAFDTSSIDEMATLIIDVWQQRTCARPLVHRVDACAVGSAPILSVPSNGKAIEAAQVFTVPDGQQFSIDSVTAVTDAQVVDFTVYADSGGSPGSVVCSSSGLAATSVFGSGARKLQLAAPCRLGQGDYWMGLKARSDLDTSPFTWSGGLLSRQSSYFIRDAQNTLGTGCTNWGPAGNCVEASQQNTQLCFMLDQGDTLFSSGFEANGL